jgi:UTP--glucose-1-phosphate uridylyltransferase
MINIYKKNNFNLIASKKVIKKNVSRWGIFKAKKINKRQFSIKDVVEKPSIKNAPSNFAIIGRYILPKKIFKILPKIKKGKGGEFHITDAIRSLINNNEKFVGYIFKGKYLDCGSMKGYINSSKEIQ